MYMKSKCLCGSFLLKEFVSILAKESTEKKAKGIPVLPEEIHISQLPEYPEYEEIVSHTQNATTNMKHWQETYIIFQKKVNYYVKKT
ncbi:hypothetical protein SAMN04487761_10119 [Lachnospiraceae bacterium C7]|nr:hypothetical protein SAMN04487761_10119 [Lachnospiraceae bacterium C7]